MLSQADGPADLFMREINDRELDRLPAAIFVEKVTTQDAVIAVAIGPMETTGLHRAAEEALQMRA